MRVYMNIYIQSSSNKEKKTWSRNFLAHGKVHAVMQCEKINVEFALLRSGHAQMMYQHILSIFWEDS
jgi:hypothetical protein